MTSTGKKMDLHYAFQTNICSMCIVTLVTGSPGPRKKVRLSASHWGPGLLREDVARARPLAEQASQMP